MPNSVADDVMQDSSLSAAIAALKAKIEAAEESSDIAQAVSELKEYFNNLGLSVVDGAINITYEETSV